MIRLEKKTSHLIWIYLNEVSLNEININVILFFSFITSFTAKQKRRPSKWERERKKRTNKVFLFSSYWCFFFLIYLRSEKKKRNKGYDRSKLRTNKKFALVMIYVDDHRVSEFNRIDPFFFSVRNIERKKKCVDKQTKNHMALFWNGIILENKTFSDLPRLVMSVSPQKRKKHLWEKISMIEFHVCLTTN